MIALKNTTFRWPIMVLVMVITCTAIYAFNQWHQQRVIKEPLIGKLEQIEGVQSVEVETTGNQGKTSYIITLSEVNNLPEIYRKMDELLLSTYKNDEYLLILADNRNSYLESVYDRIQFALMEGERTGNYTEMNEEVLRVMGEEKEELEYRLWVDQKRIYVFISSGPYYLSEIVPIRLASECGEVY